MNITSVNGLFHSQKLSFSGEIAQKTSSPFMVECPKSGNCQSFEYEKEYINNVLNALNERKDELYSYLDSITDDNGLTFTDKICAMFDMESAEIKEDTFLHKTSPENVESIVKNGFDPNKINKTEFGPGFYVGSSEGALLIYPGAKLQVKYKGNSVHGRDLNKSNAIKYEAVEKLREYLNLKPDFSNHLIWKEFEAFGKFANEYIRRTITDKLGIDGASAGGSEGYFVIFNPSAAKEIKHLDSDY